MDGPEKRKKIKLMKQKLTDIFLVLENVKKKDAMQIWTKPRKLCCGGNAKRDAVGFSLS